MKLSIIIPAYNEEKRIGPTLDSYCRFFDEKKELDYQILTVINATTDNTEQVVREYQKKYKNNGTGKISLGTEAEGKRAEKRDYGESSE